MSLDRPGSERLRDLETRVDQLWDFRSEVRGALRFIVAVQGLLLAGLAFSVWRLMAAS